MGNDSSTTNINNFASIEENPNKTSEQNKKQTIHKSLCISPVCGFNCVCVTTSNFKWNHIIIFILFCFVLCSIAGLNLYLLLLNANCIYEFTHNTNDAVLMNVKYGRRLHKELRVRSNHFDPAKHNCKDVIGWIATWHMAHNNTKRDMPYLFGVYVLIKTICGENCHFLKLFIFSFLLFFWHTDTADIKLFYQISSSNSRMNLFILYSPN